MEFREDQSRALVERVPLDSVASPTQMSPMEEEVWYRPGWGETAVLLGWRWLLFLPALGLVVIVALVPIRFGMINLMLVSWKLVAMVVLLPIVAFAKQARGVIQARREPFCIHCGYGLTGLPDHHRCPECGREYTFARIEEYRRDPAWFVERYKQGALLPARDVPFEAGKVRRKKSRDGT